jgi:hypothetical protein
VAETEVEYDELTGIIEELRKKLNCVIVSSSVQQRKDVFGPQSTLIILPEPGRIAIWAQ